MMPMSFPADTDEYFPSVIFSVQSFKNRDIENFAVLNAFLLVLFQMFRSLANVNFYTSVLSERHNFVIFLSVNDSQNC
jgi:hypothetical protein